MMRRQRNGYIQGLLDEWLECIREKNFATADRLCEELESSCNVWPRAEAMMSQIEATLPLSVQELRVLERDVLRFVKAKRYARWSEADQLRDAYNWRYEDSRRGGEGCTRIRLPDLYSNSFYY
jgi:hypothetical protein